MVSTAASKDLVVVICSFAKMIYMAKTTPFWSQTLSWVCFSSLISLSTRDYAQLMRPRAPCLICTVLGILHFFSVIQHTDSCWELWNPFINKRSGVQNMQRRNAGVTWYSSTNKVFMEFFLNDEKRVQNDIFQVGLDVWLGRLQTVFDLEDHNWNISRFLYLAGHICFTDVKQGLSKALRTGAPEKQVSWLIC